MLGENFLIPDFRQIRHSIKDIDDSYNNDWDLIAELCQNAVDAVRASDEEVGKIDLVINSNEKSIAITDNGIGIDPNDLPYLLKPFSSNKLGNDNSIGEKGVGLTYVMFSSNYFEIVSGTALGSSKGVINNAYNWKNSSDESGLNLDYSRLNDSFHGTKVTLKNVINNKFFTYTFDQLKFVLLTRTALGNTRNIWNGDKQLIINLTYIDQNNEKYSEILSNKYQYVISNLNEHHIIDLDDFVEFASKPDRSDLDKRRKLADKIIYKTGKFIHPTDNREIKYFACFVPKRSTWSDLSVIDNLITKEQLESEDYLENYGYIRYQEGITVSVKGMPTGIAIEHPSTGYAGYWSNIFIIFEDRMAKFDIGRKSLPGPLNRIYRKYSKEIFNEFLKYVTKYVSGEIHYDIDWDKDETFAEINSIIDLNSDKISFQKTPRDQEASVAAIFYECIGRGYIKEITPIISGYRNKYDLYGLWGNKKVVFEFKSKLKNIIKDFSDQQKMFDQVDCVVCWNVSEDDIQAFSNLAITVEEVRPNLLGVSSNKFPNSTHKLILANFVDPIYVIDLKLFLESIS